MFRKILMALPIVLLSVQYGAAAIQPKIKVACVGNSITFGAGLSNQARDSYPAVLGQMLGKEYEVENFGVSGTTALASGDNPYIKTKAYQKIFDYQPDVMIIKFGTNDSKGGNWKHREDFEGDLQFMIDKFSAMPSHPKIYLCLPAKCYMEHGSIRDSVIVCDVIPRIRKVAEKNAVGIIDMHAATSGMREHFRDTLHPDREASMAMAKCAYRAIKGKDIDFKLQDFLGVKSRWHGYDKYDFAYLGRTANVVVPAKPLPGNPWIWRPAFFGAFPAVDIALLSLGYHVVHYDLAFLYGSPRSLDLGTQFYQAMIKYYNLADKVVLEGFSRGGLFAVNWAAANPEKVQCIYLDAPVCDINSWPGRQRADLWQEFLQEWNIGEADMKDFRGNPLDNLKPIAKAGIPIVVVAGDSDKTVPFEENSKRLEKLYRKLHGDIEVIVKKGCDHHPHSLEAPAPVVKFILNHSTL